MGNGVRPGAESVQWWNRRRESPHGRPFLFAILKELASERGFNDLFKEIDRAAELWHRPPEEWEHDLVGVMARDGNGEPQRGQKLENWDGVYFGPMRFSYALLESLRYAGPAHWPYVGGQRIDPAAILRCRSWPDMVRFFGQLQIDVAHMPERAEFELRPTSETLARNNAQHFPFYGPLR